MKNIIIIFILLTLGTGCNKNKCETYTKSYIPIDLNDSLEYLDCFWSEESKEIFKNEEEEFAGLGAGMGIRNGWELWKGGNKLSLYFNNLGIYHPDDISSIILTSFHRKLNNRNIELQQQIEFYKDYWKDIGEWEDEGDGEKNSEEEEPEF